MGTTAGSTMRGVRVTLVALVVGMLAFGVLVGQSIGAHGEEVTADANQAASSGTFNWKVSSYLFDQPASPTPASFQDKSAALPATYDATTGWAFTGGTGTYDPVTGTASIAY